MLRDIGKNEFAPHITPGGQSREEKDPQEMFKKDKASEIPPIPRQAGSSSGLVVWSREVGNNRDRGKNVDLSGMDGVE